MMLLMGSITIFLQFWMFKVFIMLPLLRLVMRIFPKSNSIKRFHRKFKSKILWNEIISTLLEAYIEIIISIYFNYQHPLFSPSGEFISTIFSCFIFFLSVIFLPLAFVHVISNKLTTIKKPNFIRKWGALYDENKLTSKINVLFYFIFILRRALFVLTCLAAHNSTL